MPYTEFFIVILVVAALGIVYNAIKVRRNEFSAKGYNAAASMYRTVGSVIVGMVLLIVALFIWSLDAEDFNDITGAESIIQHESKVRVVTPIEAPPPIVFDTPVKTEQDSYTEARNRMRDDIYNLTRGTK